MSHTWPLPSVEKIKKAMSHKLSDVKVFVCPTLDSTNTEAKRLLSQGINTPFLVVAHTQTQGKGRLGRSFYSPMGTGLYMTVAFTVHQPLSDVTDVTAVAAIATADAIEALLGKRVQIKWVNDLYLEAHKVSGILTEAVACDGGYHLVVGIGVNITTEHFPEGMRNPAGAVLKAGEGDADPSCLCALITQKLFEYLEPSSAEDIYERYCARLMLVGRRVTCSRNFASDGAPDPRLSVEGIVEGVDRDYGLILRLDDGRITVLYGGEISVRNFLAD